MHSTHFLLFARCKSGNHLNSSTHNSIVRINGLNAVENWMMDWEKGERHSVRMHLIFVYNKNNIFKKLHWTQRWILKIFGWFQKYIWNNLQVHIKWGKIKKRKNGLFLFIWLVCIAAPDTQQRMYCAKNNRISPFFLQRKEVATVEFIPVVFFCSLCAFFRCWRCCCYDC